MIMRQGQQLLLPAKPIFIWTSLFVAFGLSMLLGITFFGRAPWPPDLLALVMVFWIVHQNQRVGVGIAFMFGLFVDVHQGALLGQHGLAYTMLGFLAASISNRLLFFTVPSQAIQVFPIFFVAHAVELTVRMIAGADFPGYSILVAPVLEALLWPIVSIILLAPQRRAPDPDAHRPL